MKTTAAFIVADLTVKPHSLPVERAGKSIELTPREVAMLRLRISKMAP